MTNTPAATWIRAGVFTLPVYGLLTAWSVWRSGILPRWAGGLWIAAWVVFVVLGAALGMATTGASLPTQPIGAGLMVISGAWMAWTATKRPAVIAEPQPSHV